MKTLARMQRGLETLYRVETGVEVGHFVCSAEFRDELCRTAPTPPSRKAREQLLVVEQDGEMNLALFIEPAVIARLDGHGHDLQDMLLAVEGVSHFIYTVWCARHERPLSQLELELQAEVDKYVTCLLQMDADPGASAELRWRLFESSVYEDDLDEEEQHRYRAANDNAARYASYLEDAFVARRRIPEMLAELRRFYRQSLAAKLSTIARAA